MESVSGVVQVGRLRREYEKVLGRQREEAATLQSAPIELPSDLEGLQVTSCTSFQCFETFKLTLPLQLRALQLREELIETRAGREHVEDELRAEILSLREEVAAEREGKQRQLAEFQVNQREVLKQRCFSWSLRGHFVTCPLIGNRNEP